MYHNGRATLFDFSVSEEYSPDETLRNDAGTTEYMALEQTYRRELGYYTDVLGVGVLFYRLLSGGKLPYQVIEVDDEDKEGDGKPSVSWTTISRRCTHRSITPKTSVMLYFWRPQTFSIKDLLPPCQTIWHTGR